MRLTLSLEEALVTCALDNDQRQLMNITACVRNGTQAMRTGGGVFVITVSVV